MSWHWPVKTLQNLIKNKSKNWRISSKTTSTIKLTLNLHMPLCSKDTPKSWLRLSKHSHLSSIKMTVFNRTTNRIIKLLLRLLITIVTSRQRIKSRNSNADAKAWLLNRNSRQVYQQCSTKFLSSGPNISSRCPSWVTRSSERSPHKTIVLTWAVQTVTS